MKMSQRFHAYAYTYANALYSRSSHRDFSVFLVYTLTAVTEMSQSRLCFMRMQSCSHVVMQPYNHSRYGDFSALTACVVTVAMEISQRFHAYTYTYANALCSRSSHRDFSAFLVCTSTAVTKMSQSRLCFMQPCSHAITLAMEISQSSQSMQSLHQWRYLSHTHIYIYAYAHAYCSHIVIAVI